MLPPSPLPPLKQSAPGEGSCLQLILCYREASTGSQDGFYRFLWEFTFTNLTEIASEINLPLTLLHYIPIFYIFWINWQIFCNRFGRFVYDFRDQELMIINIYTYTFNHENLSFARSHLGIQSMWTIHQSRLVSVDRREALFNLPIEGSR